MNALLRSLWLGAWSVAAGFAAYFLAWAGLCALYGVSPGSSDTWQRATSSWVGFGVGVIVRVWASALDERTLNWLVMPLRLAFAVAGTVLSVVLIYQIALALSPVGEPVGALAWLVVVGAMVLAALASFGAASKPLPELGAIVQQVRDFRRRATPSVVHFFANWFEEQLQDSPLRQRHIAGPERISQRRAAAIASAAALKPVPKPLPEATPALLRRPTVLSRIGLGREVLDFRAMLEAVRARAKALHDAVGAATLPSLSASHPLRETLPFGGVELTALMLERGAAFVGPPGTGKTTAILRLLKRYLKKLGSPACARAIAFALKPEDQARYTDGMGVDPSRVVLLNPLNDRTADWALGRDLSTLTACEEFAASLLPPKPHGMESDFWNRSAAPLVANGLYWLAQQRGDALTLREVVRVMSDEADLAHVIRSCPATSQIAMYVTEKRGVETLAGILLTVRKEFARLATTADLLEQARRAGARRYSVTEWLEGGDCLVVGFSLAFPEAAKPFAHLLLELLARRVLQFSAHTDLEPNISVFALDEVQHAGPIAVLSELVEAGRSRGVRAVLGVQDPRQFDAVYGEKVGPTILAMFGTRAVFPVDDGAIARRTAEWFGARLVRRETRSVDAKGQPSGAQERLEEVQLLPAYELLELNRPGRLRGFFRAKELGMWSNEERVRDIAREFPASTADEMREHIAHAASVVHAMPLDEAERRALGLPPREEPGGSGGGDGPNPGGGPRGGKRSPRQIELFRPRRRGQ